MESTYRMEEERVSVAQYIIVTESETKQYLVWDTADTKKRLEEEVSWGRISYESCV